MRIKCAITRGTGPINNNICFYMANVCVRGSIQAGNRQDASFGTTRKSTLQTMHIIHVHMYVGVCSDTTQKSKLASSGHKMDKNSSKPV